MSNIVGQDKSMGSPINYNTYNYVVFPRVIGCNEAIQLYEACL